MKKQYYCKVCGAYYLEWQGKCNYCNNWNCIEEIIEEVKEQDLIINDKFIENNKNLEKIELFSNEKYTTNLSNLNNLLNGGIIPGQVLLLSGEPGIGKSTLLAQICKRSSFKILYISGEENLSQIKQRFLRIGEIKDYCNIDFQSITELSFILSNIQSKKYQLIIIDSIQTVYSKSIDSAPGSQVQIKTSGQKIVEFCKKNNVSAFIIAQINKEGYIAGPKLLEHIVDTVLYFEGDQKSDTRILKVTKNRYGNINEIAIYQMDSKGLIEVDNIEKYYISDIENKESGVTFSIYNQGNSFFIIETQALCVKTYFNYPKRITNGFDAKRLEMIIAVLSKKLKYKLEKYDIYVNILGGIQIDDAGLDLSVACAIISSIQNKTFNSSTCFIGELSLTGDIRNAPKQNKRIEKAKNFGFQEIISNKQFKTLQKVLKLLNY